MAPSFLVEQFQRQEREQGGCGGDHPRAGVPGLGDDSIEAEPGQEGQGEEGAPRRANGSCARAQGSVRDSLRRRASPGPVALTRTGTRGRPRPSGRKRGARRLDDNRPASDWPSTSASRACSRTARRRIPGARHRRRAEGLVLTLEGLLWLEEEPPGAAPVHDACSRTLIIFRPESAAERTAKTGAEKGRSGPGLARASKTRRRGPECIGTVKGRRM